MWQSYPSDKVADETKGPDKVYGGNVNAGSPVKKISYKSIFNNENNSMLTWTFVIAVNTQIRCPFFPPKKTDSLCSKLDSNGIT